MTHTHTLDCYEFLTGALLCDQDEVAVHSHTCPLCEEPHQCSCSVASPAVQTMCERCKVRTQRHLNWASRFRERATTRGKTSMQHGAWCVRGGVMMADELEFTSPIRCYNGDFDSKTQRVLDAQDKVLREIRKIEPEAHVTYFPSEEKYDVHVWGKSLSGGWHNTRGSALASALARLLKM